MNRTSLIVASSICICCFALLVSCDKKVGRLSASETPPPPPGACDSITYTKHIKKIIDDNCIACHGDNQPVGGFSLNSYAQVKTYADNGQLKSTVFDSQPELMPQGGPALPQAQKDLITCWLNNGKKQ